MLTSTFSKLRRTLTVRKKKNRHNENSSGTKPAEWLADETKIKEGFCSFVVKYLGSIEVFESRGVQVCELAIKALNKKKSFRLFRKRGQRAILTVTGDELKVSDEVSKHLLVDQTIEKVSFCAPDRFNPQGFAYICRDGATRRWMCHAFLAVNNSGERLSHAVGCAFNICLEKKQQREKDSLQVTFNENKTSFTRNGTFRQTTLAERLADPQMVLSPPPKDSSATLAIEYPNPEKKTSHALVPTTSRPRPHAFQSTRLPNRIPENSPLRREVSLKETISNQQILKAFHGDDDTGDLLSENNYSQSICNSTTKAHTPKDPFSSAPVDMGTILKWQSDFPANITINEVNPVTMSPEKNNYSFLETILNNSNGPTGNVSNKSNEFSASAHGLALCESKDPFDLEWCEKIENHDPLKDGVNVISQFTSNNNANTTSTSTASKVNNPFL